MVDERSELTRLRKLKRLRELEARAAGQPSGLPVPARPSQPSFPTVAETGGGRIVDMGGGRKGFQSPGYSTTNPAEVRRIQQGMTPTPAIGRYEEIVQRNPIGARAMQFVKGIPFAGEYIDEAAGAVMGQQAQRNARDVARAMEVTRPGQSIGYQALGATVATAPLMVGAAPVGAAAQMTPQVQAAAQPLMSRMLRGFGVGGVAGAAEGTVAGFGAGEGGVPQRAQQAQERGMTGAVIGGGIGSLLPAGEAIIGGALQAGGRMANATARFFRGEPVEGLARRLGISRPAANIIQNAVEAGDPQRAQAILQRLGPEATLADANQAAMAQLDASMIGGVRAPEIVQQAMGPRFAREAQETNDALTRYLGQPMGRERLVKELRDESSPVTDPLYRAAYAQPIDYSQAGGRAIEDLLRRVPQSAINQANALMRLRGEQSAQIMAQVDDAGNVTFSQLPDVRQLDYITRGLQAVARAEDTQGAMGGQTPLGSSMQALAREIRSTARREVPQYDKALRAANDAIAKREAIDTGRELLNPSLEPDALAMRIQDLEPGQLEYARYGLRSAIEARINNVRQVASDPNMDARQMAELVKSTSSPAAREKISMLLPPQQAQALIDRLDETMMSLELRAAIARNSATAQRTAAQGRFNAQMDPGVVDLLKAGRGLKAYERLVQEISGETPAAVALRNAGVHDQIAYALTNIRGQDARDALALINQTRQGRELTQRQQQFVARVLSRPAAVGAFTASTTQQDLRSMSDDQLNAELRRLGY
jgi:hypothetical protein